MALDRANLAGSLVVFSLTSTAVVLGGWMLVMSVFAVIAFAIDKNSAIHHRRRIPEKRLHLLELLGGWPGAIIAACMFRHKIRKASYVMTMCVVVAVWTVSAWFLRSYLIN